MKKNLFKLVWFALLLSLLILATQTTQAKTQHGFSHSPVKTAQQIPTDPALLKGKLSNGLQYYILQHRQPANSVELRLVVRAGSVNEREHEQGISHFLEHMVFNGTTQYPGHKLIDTLENMGVQFGTDLNAYTGFDETTYILPIPLDDPKNLDVSIGILEELAFNATMLPEDIDQERSVIIEEWRASGLSASAHQQEHNLRLTAHGSIYAERMPIGKMDVVQNASPQLLREFYKRRYRPNLMSVVVVGDIEPQHVRMLIEKHFASYKNPAASPASPQIILPNNSEPLAGVFYDKTLSQSTVMLANKDQENFVALNTAGGYMQALRQSLMVSMINQRLVALLDSPTTTPPFLQAFVDFDYVSGIVRSKKALQWYAVAAPTKELSTLELLRNEALRLKRYGFTQPELDRAVREHLTYLNNDSNNYQKATEYVTGIVENEPLPELEWERVMQANYLPRVSLGEVNSMVSSLIQDTNQVALINSNEPTNYISQAQILKVLSNKPILQPYTESKYRDALLLELPKAGRIVDTDFYPEIALTVWTLSNGVQVGFKAVPNNDGPIVFSGVSKGGFSRLSNENYKKVRWGFNGLIEGGVNGLSKTQVNHILAGKDLSMQLSIDESTQGVSGKFSSNDTESAMQMIYSMLTGVNKNNGSFSNYIARGVDSSESLKNDRDVQFEQMIQSTLNQSNSRFTSAFPFKEDWAATDFDTTYTAYRQAFSNANGMQFVFVGNGSEAQIKKLSELYLGSLPSDISARNKTLDLGQRLSFPSRTIVLSKGKEALAQVRIIFGGESTYDEDKRLALHALAHALNIRLVERLREEEGGVYSPYVDATMTKIPYSYFNFEIGFNCAPANVDSLIKSTQDEIQKLVDAGIREQDLLKFKQSEKATYAKRISTNEFWVSGIRQAYLNETAPTSLIEYPRRVNDLDINSVHSAAEKFLSNKPFIAILKPE